MNDIKEITELKKTLDKISSICYTTSKTELAVIFIPGGC